MNYTNRPLSPHLSIYKIQQKSTISIFNRISTLIMISILFAVTILLKFILIFINFNFSGFVLILLFTFLVLNLIIHTILNYIH